MDWKDVANEVSKAAPLLGTVLGGPAGGAIGGLIASALGTAHAPDDVAQALTTNPDAAVKLKQIEADHDVEIKKLVFAHADNELAADTQRIQAVNASIQSEAKSDHFPTYTWRPFIGFTFGLYVTALWALPLMGKAPVTLSPDITLAIGGILGVASWFRGKAQADPALPTDNRG